MQAPAFVLQNFFLILRTVQRNGLPSGVVCIVLRHVITPVGCEIPRNSIPNFTYSPKKCGESDQTLTLRGVVWARDYTKMC